MIKKLMNEETFFKAYLNTKNELSKTLNKENTYEIQWISGEVSNSGDKLFDNSRYYDQQKILFDGKVDNSSIRWGMTNIESSLRDFYGRKDEMWKLIQIILKGTIRTINIYGNPRSGKTSFIKEFAKYISVRDIVDDKVFYHDFTKCKQMKDCEQFFL